MNGKSRGDTLREQHDAQRRGAGLSAGSPPPASSRGMPGWLWIVLAIGVLAVVVILVNR